MFVGSDYHWKVWRGLEYSVRTGETAARHVLGTDVWTYRQQHPETGVAFDLAMESNSNHLVDNALAGIRFRKVRDHRRRWRRHRSLSRGDPEPVSRLARRAVRPATSRCRCPAVLERAGVAIAVRSSAGFFQAVPEHGDAYVLKSILHDWNDEDALAILRTCRRAMATARRCFWWSGTWANRTTSSKPSSPISTC